MKNKSVYILVFMFLFFIIKGGQALAINEPHINLQKVSFPADIILKEQNIIFLPVWRLAERFDLEVFTDPKTRTVSLKKDEKWLNFSGEQEEVSTSDGLSKSAVFLFKNDNIYVPIEFIAEFFDYDVSFEQKELNKQTPNKEQENNDVQDSLIPVPASNKTVKEQVPIQPQKPKVYLTFDDGPNRDIVPILDTLKAKGAKATFFMLEPQMKQFSNEVKRLVEEGHYPALHSVTHDRNKLYSGDPLNVAKEMEETRKTLMNITGVDSKLTRVPYGSKPFMKDALRNSLVDYGFKMWDWTIDTVDWKYQSQPRRIVEKVKEGIQISKGKNEPIVILMHVNKGTASVLAEIIDYLYKEGYECAAYNPEHHFSVNFWGDERL